MFGPLLHGMAINKQLLKVLSLSILSSFPFFLFLSFSYSFSSFTPIPSFLINLYLFFSILSFLTLVLQILVRQTSINAYRYVRYNTQGYSKPYVLRNLRIQEIMARYKSKSDYEDLVLSIVQKPSEDILFILLFFFLFSFLFFFSPFLFLYCGTLMFRNYTTTSVGKNEFIKLRHSWRALNYYCCQVFACIFIKLLLSVLQPPTMIMLLLYFCLFNFEIKLKKTNW